MPAPETQHEREAVKPPSYGWSCPRCGEEYYGTFRAWAARRCYESHVLTETLSDYDPEDAKYEAL